MTTWADPREGFGLDPFSATPGELLRSVADLAPGPYLQSVLMMVDRSTLDPEDALLFLQLHDRVASWWAGLQAEALVAAADPTPRVDEYLVLDPRPDHHEERLVRIHDAAREEVAVSLRMSPATAQHRIDHARLLAGPLAGTRAALELGEITPRHAAIICDAALRLSSRLAAVVPDASEAALAAFGRDCHSLEATTLRVARRADLSRTRRAATRAVERVDAEGQRRRREAARCTRDVYVTPGEDGIVTLVARLDALAAHAIMRAVEGAVADPGVPGDPAATVGERRAEVLAHLILNGSPGAGTTRQVQLDVVVPLASLLDGSDVAGQLPDGTPVGLEQLAELLSEPGVACTLRRLVTDPVSGHVIDVGRRRYEIPSALRRHVVLRDRTCRFPGCSRRASRCQIDHAQAWEDGGRTDGGNLGVLCVRHHQLKTHGGWRVEASRPDGSCTWVSPLGQRYFREPEALLDTRDPPDPPPF